MAQEHDGFVTIQLSVRMAWWVAPYMCAVKAFLGLVAPFLEDDDGRLGNFITQQVGFVCKHGVRFYFNEKRV